MIKSEFSDEEMAAFAEDQTLLERIPWQLALLHVWATDVRLGYGIGSPANAVTALRTITAFAGDVRFTLLRIYGYGRESESADPLELEIAIHVRALLMERHRLKKWPAPPLRWEHHLSEHDYFGVVHMPKEMR